MKMSEAMTIIKDGEKKLRTKPKNNPKVKNIGFMVSFEIKERNILRSDHFPDKHAGEKLIKTEEEAWNLARRFANATLENKNKYVNIYVIRGEDFGPVKGYSEKEIRPY